MTKPLTTYDPSQAWQEHLCTSPTFGYSQVESHSCSCCLLNTQKEKKPCPNCLCICTAPWPKVTPRQWLVSFVTSCFPHCQWAALSLSDFPASQRGYKSIPTQLKPLTDIKLESRRDFPVLIFFLLTFQSTTFLWEKKKVVLFFSQCTLALTLAEKQIRNAACAPEEPVPQVLALHHRIVSISSVFSPIVGACPSLFNPRESKSPFWKFCSIDML